MDKNKNTEDLILKSLATKKTKEFILAHPEYKLNLWQKLRLNYFNYLKKQGWSTAYIAGHKEFFGLDFKVNRYTLIPRPETELMIEEVLNEISKSKITISKQIQNPNSQNIILIDIGTGTGCIPIAIASVIARPKVEAIPLQTRDCRVANAPRNDIKIFATDISRGALRVAKHNAKKHGVKIDFSLNNLLNQKLISNFLNFPRLAVAPARRRAISSLIITANLPYLTQQQFEKEPSIQKEPKNALVADNNNGLSLYKQLLEQTKTLKYQSVAIFLEIDPSQTSSIKKIITEILPNSTTEIKNDLAGRDRLVIIRLNS